MKRYWVTGGIYKSTDFEVLAPGEELQKHGPYEDYEEARKMWQSLAWANVDDCQAFFTIETEDAPVVPQHWVFGGSYQADGSAGPDGEQRFGPFEDYEDAKKEWQRLAWETVDDASARYRIETFIPEETAEEPEQRLAYRVLTGPDNAEFCQRVSAALSDGYALHGSPSLTTRGGQVIVAQALVLVN